MNRKGFTLVELLIVIAIIGIVAAIAIPNLLIALQKGKQKATMGDLKTLGGAIESYITDWSFAPQVAAGVITPLNVGWFSPFYIKILPTQDGWGTLFQYDREALTNGVGGDLYSIYSFGRDKVTGVPTVQQYDVASLADFNWDIYYSNGVFSVGPRTKK